ncbi:MAG: FMN-binding protein [Kosmotoga sp.]|nr:MAG: FMN-binding protein [Kosmotoga sp.]
MKRKTKMILTVIIAIIGVSLIGFIVVMRNIESNLEELKALNIQDINISSVPDGKYKGSYSAFPISAEVEVTVSSGEIVDIELIKHDHGKGGAAEAIPEKVVEKQSLKVDVITSATYSSKVILKAIENALLNAVQ